MATSRIQIRKSGAACDRCYELKERCTRSSVVVNCTRCHRLGLICTTIRPVKAAGRRSKHQKLSFPKDSKSIQSNSSPPCHINTPGWLRDAPNLSQREKELLELLFERPENADYFLLNSTILVVEQRSLLVPLPAVLPILKDAYIACAMALNMLRAGNVVQINEDSGLRYASSAIATSMSLPTSTFRDGTLSLTLGAVLASYVYSAVGVGMADISRYCLSTTASLLETTRDTGTKSCQAFLVLMEIMDCVVHRRKPTLKIQLVSPESIDSHLGLCLPLLQYYHDICVINHTMRSKIDTMCFIPVQKTFDEIHQALEEWRPSLCGDVIDEYKPAKVVDLLAQAKVFRLAGLLLIHRSRYLFNQQDDQADIWSKEILIELEVAHMVTKRTIRCVTLPFVVAAVEIRDSNARLKVLQNVDTYVDQFSPLVKKAIQTFLGRVWLERDSKATTCWFDSVCKPCVVLNSINAGCFA